VSSDNCIHLHVLVGFMIIFLIQVLEMIIVRSTLLSSLGVDLIKLISNVRPSVCTYAFTYVCASIDKKF